MASKPQKPIDVEFEVIKGPDHYVPPHPHSSFTEAFDHIDKERERLGLPPMAEPGVRQPILGNGLGVTMGDKIGTVLTVLVAAAIFGPLMHYIIVPVVTFLVHALLPGF